MREEEKNEPIYVPLTYYKKLPQKSIYSKATLGIDWSSFRHKFGGIDHRNGRLFYSEQQIILKEDVTVEGQVKYEKDTALSENIVKEMIVLRQQL